MMNIGTIGYKEELEEIALLGKHIEEGMTTEKDYIAFIKLLEKYTPWDHNLIRYMIDNASLDNGQ